MKSFSINKRKLHFEPLEDRQLLSANVVSDFEDLFADYNPNNKWRGDLAMINQPNSFVSGPCEFSNLYSYDDIWDWTSWNGFGYSQMTDTTTEGVQNELSAITGRGADDSETYGIGFDNDATITILPEYLEGYQFSSIMVTNTTYAYLSMKNGDGFAKKFGGTSGNDADWFLLTITGKDSNGHAVGTVDFYLADFRFADNSQDYIIDTWVQVDISSLKDATSLQFSFTSSDIGPWGMNNPTYCAIDNIVLEAKDAIPPVDPPTLDVNGDGNVTTADVNLLLRYLYEYSGNDLTRLLATEDSTRTTSEQITEYLVVNNSLFDINGDGSVTTADANLLLRYLYDYSGDDLTRLLVPEGSTRTTSEQIITYIESVLPTSALMVAEDVAALSQNIFAQENLVSSEVGSTTKSENSEKELMHNDRVDHFYRFLADEQLRLHKKHDKSFGQGFEHENVNWLTDFQELTLAELRMSRAGGKKQFFHEW